MLVVVALAAGAMAVAPGARAAPGIYLDTTDIVLPTAGPADRYPAEFAVDGMPKGVATVRLGIHSFDHPSPADVDILVTSPSGRAVLLMSDVEAAAPDSPASLTFSSTAAGEIPSTGPLVTGEYLPTNLGPSDSFPFPAPSRTTWSTSLDTLRGTDPNGTWRLYVVDDDGSSPGGIIDAWTLTITTVTPPAAPVIVSPTSGFDTDGAFVLSGTKSPNSIVTVYEGGTPVGTVSVQVGTTWSTTFYDQAPGLHAYVATAVDGYGNTSPPSAVKTIAIDVVHPKVLRTSPTAGAADVRRGRDLRALFSEPLRSDTVTGANVRLVRVATGTVVRAAVSYDADARTVVLDPRRRLAADASYKMVVRTAVKDIAGNRLDQNTSRTGNQPKVWRFRTR
jgi:hypothetical protein